MPSKSTLYFTVLIILVLIIISIPNSAIFIENSNKSSNGQHYPDETALPETDISETAQENLAGLTRSSHTDKLEYIVIGTDSFKSASQPLIDWKSRKGVPAEFKSTEDILTEYSDAGLDDLHKIREFLKDKYESHPELKWILLMGDSEIIPIRMLYAGAEEYGMNKFYASDHYFGALDGTWDSNGNGIYYGEQSEDEDWDSELYVGRLPVSTSSEVTSAVNKILDYERSPPAGNWYEKALIMGSLMDAPNVEDDLATFPPEDEGYNDYKDNAYEVSKKALEYFPSYYELTELYDYSQIPSGDYSLDTDTLTQDNAVAEFNKGYALINFAGQARFNGNSIMQYEYAGGTGTYQHHRFVAWRDLYTYDDAGKASNGGMLPFMVMPTCDAANFTEVDDTNLEVLFTAANGGTIGLISSTGVSHRGESFDGNSYGNWWEDEEFWKIFFRNDIYQPGQALAELKSSFAATILSQSDTNPRIYHEAIKGNLEGLTLLGDPEVPIWTKVPSELSVDTTNLTTGDVNVEISVNDKETGTPVKGALVALSGPTLYEYGKTDESGMVQFDLNLDEPGTANLTVTAHNYLPLESTENIPYAPPIIETIYDLTINEDEFVLDYVKLTEAVTDADTAFNDLTIDISSSEENAGVVINENMGIDILPERDWHGESQVTVSAADDIYTTLMNFKVTVISVNDPPELLGLPDGLQVWESIELFAYSNISATDPDSTTLKFSDNTNIFDINSSTGRISFIPTFDSVGNHNICISVTDGFAVTKECFSLTVFNVPDPPSIAAIGTLSATAGEKFSYAVNAFDNDGDTLIYTVEPSWVEIDTSTGIISMTPGSDKVGEHDVTVYASDGVHTTSETFTLKVESSFDYKLIAMILVYVLLGLVIVIGFLLKRKKVIADEIVKSEKPKAGKKAEKKANPTKKEPELKTTKKGIKKTQK
jgi:hypothetical protein